MSPQATYYPVEASALNREYRSRFKPQSYPRQDLLAIASYQLSPAPSALYPDTPSLPKLTDRTGGGYNGSSLAHWVGFRVEETGGTVRVTADFGEVKQVDKIRLLTQSWLASGIYRPAVMSVEVSTNGSSWTPYGGTATFPNNTVDFAVMWGEVSGNASARYVRLTLMHTGWLFVSEIEAFGKSVTPPPPPPAGVTITVSPGSVSLRSGETAQFTTTVTGTTNTGVLWAILPSVGQMQGGLYTAPSPVTGAQTINVYAISAADTTKWAESRINLTPTLAAPPSVGPMNPAEGTGTSRMFSFQAEAGTGSLQWVLVLFSNGGVTQTGGCMVYYRPSDDAVAVSADSATPSQYDWAETGTLGGGEPINNSQCAVDPANSTVLKQGSAITLNLSMTFTNWSGAKQVYMATQDDAQMTAWPLVGYWTIP